jgi:hypothetical protein
MAKITRTKIKQPSFGEKRLILTYTKISRFTVWLFDFRGEDFLEINQSAIRIAYGGHVC